MHRDRREKVSEEECAVCQTLGAEIANLKQRLEAAEAERSLLISCHRALDKSEAHIDRLVEPNIS